MLFGKADHILSIPFVISGGCILRGDFTVGSLAGGFGALWYFWLAEEGESEGAKEDALDGALECRLFC